MSEKQTTILCLGSNLGERKLNLSAAISSLERRVGSIIRKSSIYESEPWGMDSVNQFYNQCISLSTAIGPVELMEQITGIEREMGRKGSRGDYTDRVIDIDILFFGDIKIDTDDLIIPHPRISERRFVLVPLLEIYPDMINPTNLEKFQDTLDSCTDLLSVKKIY
jgi:2-amino-4-hydroxy-6-hydroxymethyldihydropteridine diphosphokinase